jgi:hypothetical protein
LFLLRLLLLCSSDQLELSEHSVVHLFVVQVGFVAVDTSGGGVGAGAPAPGRPAAIITDALIAALITRKLSKIIQHVAELLAGNVSPDVALWGLRFLGYLLSTSGPGEWGSSQGRASPRRRCRVVRDSEGRGGYAHEEPLPSTE